MKENLYKRQLRIALLYFCIATVLGLLLRSFSMLSFDFNYRYVVHAHSHIALLGWVYVALTTLLHYGFAKDTSKKTYNWIFWATQITLVGMLLTFPFQGYALFSIIFSTLFLITSYIFTCHFWKNIAPAHKKSNALKCAKASLVYMVVSSLGPWALGIIMSTLGTQSIWYRLSIYFYLHFQYNGWMLLALLGLFLFALEQRGHIIPQKSFVLLFKAINIGIILTFFLSTLWTEPSAWLYVLGGVGAMVQIGAFLFFWTLTKNGIRKLSLTNLQSRLLYTAVALTCIKLILQLITAIPYFARMASRYLDFTIGYLHLTFLGVLTLGLFFLVDYLGLLRMSKSSIAFYMVGFLLTETLIFFKGFSAWLQWKVFTGYALALILCSLFIFLGLMLILFNNRAKS